MLLQISKKCTYKVQKKAKICPNIYDIIELWMKIREKNIVAFELATTGKVRHFFMIRT